MEQIVVKKLNYNNFAPLFGDWAEKFRPFIEGEEMFEIYQRLKTESMTYKITPASHQTFRAFQVTPPFDVRAIFYLMDPYPRAYPNKTLQATGIAMDCSNSPDGKLQPSLVKWYDAMQKELGKEIYYSPSLEYLHEQGVMLLNTDLTCRLNQTQSHERLWEPLQKYFLEEVVGSDAGIIYVLCGKASLRMKRYINPFCKTYELTHPAAASHKGIDWDSEGIFTKINRSLLDNHGKNYQIHWDKDSWDQFKTPPF